MAEAPRPKLTCVDTLRGLAVLAVVLYHLRGGDRPQAYHPAVATFLEPFRYGFSGVHLFLVLSGFCLTYSLLRRRRAGLPIGYRDYMAARWWRIAPPYYAATALYLAFPVAYLLVGHLSPTTGLLTVRQVGSHLLFAHGLWRDTIHAINVPFWTLSLEFQFYLLLPVLVALAGRVGVGPVVGMVAASSLAWRAWLRWARPDLDHLLGGLFLGRWTEFALGMAVAYWFESPARGRGSVGVAAALGLVLLAAAAAVPGARSSGPPTICSGSATRPCSSRPSRRPRAAAARRRSPGSPPWPGSGRSRTAST
jgi:peptidoglycan/LPS O-acetylase OafA/YrhL